MTRGPRDIIHAISERHSLGLAARRVSLDPPEERPTCRVYRVSGDRWKLYIPRFGSSWLENKDGAYFEDGEFMPWKD